MKVRIVLFFFLLNALGVNGQFVPAEVIPSQEKTIINGRVYIIHTVQKGQTFFSICRAYNVSQEDVLRENPGVAPETLKEGSTLRMPVGSGIDAARQHDRSKFYEHRVRRRQTVYSIARRYDVSEEVIYRYNPQARDGIKVDQILLIPKGNINGTDPVQVTETVKEDVINDEVPDVIAPCSPAEAQTYNVALLLPLFTDYFRSLQSGNALQANTNTTQVQIPALSREFAEFYEGFLLAADSMRQAGMSVNLHVYDTDRDNSKIASIQKNMMSDNPDLIIGPVFTEQMNLISNAFLNRDIPIVSPLSTSTALINSNKNIFQVTPSKDDEAAALAAYLMRFNKGRFILVRDSVSRDDSWRFKNKIMTLLESQPGGQSRLTEITLYEALKGDLGNILLKDQTNYVIVFSESEPDVGELVARFYMESSKHDIVLIGQPVWQIWKTLELSFLHKLQLTLYTPFHVDYTKSETMAFLRKCHSIYGFEPYEISRSGYNFCMLGYDMGLFFLTALKEYGKYFVNCIQNHKPSTLLSEYLYSGGGDRGYTNGNVSIIRYNQDFTIENIKIKVP